MKKAMQEYFVYILTNKYNTALYVGMTNNLDRRLLEHKKRKGHFSNSYNLSKLVYIETAENIWEAMQREKQLKNWHHKWKRNLISEANPKWQDLLNKLS